jgi:uncharacterized coiled-coil protein SlyX
MSNTALAEGSEMEHRIERLESRADRQDDKLDKILESVTKVGAGFEHVQSAVSAMKTDFEAAVSRVTASLRGSATEHREEDDKRFRELTETIARQNKEIEALKSWKERSVGIAIGVSGLVGFIVSLVTIAVGK